MCGFAGYLTTDPKGERGGRALLEAMTEPVAHRGPDDAGVQVVRRGTIEVGLGHRRLAIIDPTATGRQPMRDGTGRYRLLYNGAVYNFGELREELRAAGTDFRGGSDTEVVVEACARWGVEEAVDRFVGMFAFALWDGRDATLHLVRDRLGIKPLYYGRAGGDLVFGSELKSLRGHHDFGHAIDRRALGAYLRYGYVPAPWSIQSGIRKLPAGCMLSLDGPDDADRSPTRYWSAREVARNARARPFTGDRTAAVAALEKVLAEAVGCRLVADVPLGAFLSGGIDSSLVVALMQRASDRPVRTFSVGFRQPGYDEAQHARAVADRLGTHHAEHYVTPEMARDVIPRLGEIYDEPFADASQIPTILLAEFTRREVKVCLSGDGGDELFGGYTRYRRARRLGRWVLTAPAPLRLGLGRLLAETERIGDSGTLARVRRALPVSVARHVSPRGLRRARAYLTAESMEDIYRRTISRWEPSEVLEGEVPDEMFEAWGMEAAGRNGFQSLEWMMLQDMDGYLPDDILVKVDRATMAVGLEARVPLLDHRVVEFAWRLPLEWKAGGGDSKRLLREVLYRYVPRDLVDRPKRGFRPPLGEWLRGPLRDWAEALIEPSRLDREGYLRADVVHALWRDHLSGRVNHLGPLWSILVLQSWLDVAGRD